MYTTNYNYSYIKVGIDELISWEVGYVIIDFARIDLACGSTP